MKKNKRQNNWELLKDAVLKANTLLFENDSLYRLGISNQNYRVNIDQCRPDQLQSDGFSSNTAIRGLIYGITEHDAIVFVNAIIKGFYLLTNNKAIQ